MREACCEANDYGFKCHCRKDTFPCEDDGYGDWLYDQERDRRIEEALDA